MSDAHEKDDREPLVTSPSETSPTSPSETSPIETSPIEIRPADASRVPDVAPKSAAPSSSTSAEAAPGRAGMVGRASGRLHPLFALLLLALAIRVAAAVWPNVIYPDEVFQYLEPAWRMLGHDGVLTWEWREGIRGWFLPTLLAGPVALGDAIAATLAAKARRNV
jgi:hypothetical protein